jgi:CYTH domain-containing protein
MSKLLAMRTEVDEAANPKYAHCERERRWRVDPARRPPMPEAHLLVEDRYIEETRLRLRRITEPTTGRKALKLTRKYETDDPLARPIVTAYLTDAEYEVFAALPARALAKRRYHVEEGGREFNLDCFLGPLEGLELTEIECADDAGLRALPPPLWAGREVSHDPHYQGGALALHGLPED